MENLSNNTNGQQKYRCPADYEDCEPEVEIKIDASKRIGNWKLQQKTVKIFISNISVVFDNGNKQIMKLFFIYLIKAYKVWKVLKILLLVWFSMQMHKHDFLSIRICSMGTGGQQWSMTLLWYCKNNIDTNQNSVYSGLSSHPWVLDRLGV